MGVDLLPLVPLKFQDSAILNALIDILNEGVDAWNTSIAALQQLQDPYNVPSDYLQYLADHVGFRLSSADEVSASARRKELIGAVDWYKMKGTYESLNLIALWASFDFVIYDKYCNSESNYNNGVFTDVEWFVGDENENPADLDSTYFKTPHFGINVDLDTIYAAGDYSEGYLERHLWRPSLFVGIPDHVEKTRPVNTVPSYLILHTCIADESGDPYTITGTDTITRVVGLWSVSRLFFDETTTSESGLESGTSSANYFDSGEYFDRAVEIFLTSITKWKLSVCEMSQSGESGAGEVRCMDLEGDEPVGGFVLDDVVLEGTIDGYVVYDDRIEFTFVVPLATVQYGINELGLYRVAGASEELMVASTFPVINKGSSTALKVIVVIYRTLDL